MKKVTLIGGKFHRTKVEMDNNQRSYIMAIPPKLSPVQMVELCSEPIPIKTVKYHQVMCIFGEFDVIPENVFIEENTDPVTFLRNLVLDYVR